MNILWIFSNFICNTKCFSYGNLTSFEIICVVSNMYILYVFVGFVSALTICINELSNRQPSYNIEDIIHQFIDLNCDVALSMMDVMSKESTKGKYSSTSLIRPPLLQ